MSHCTSCGEPLPEGGRFCPSCGHRVDTTNAGTPKIGLAVTAFVLGLIGLVLPIIGIVTGALGIVLGYRYRKTRRGVTPAEGVGLATAGMVLGGLSLLTAGWFTFVVTRAFLPTRQKPALATSASCPTPSQRSLRKVFTSLPFRVQFQSGALHECDPTAQLLVPRARVDLIVAEGTSPETLRSAPGHYMTTAAPGSPGNVGIAGNFPWLGRLRAGDVAILVTPVGRYTYTFLEPFDGHPNPWAVDAHDFSVIESTPTASLSLTSRGTGTSRIVARFVLTKSELLDVTRAA